MHSINRIKKAQQHGNYKTPRLWAKAKGINHGIASETANYIMDIVVLYNADTIVFEHLDKMARSVLPENRSSKCGEVRKFNPLLLINPTD